MLVLLGSGDASVGDQQKWAYAAALIAAKIKTCFYSPVFEEVCWCESYVATIVNLSLCYLS